MAFDHSAAAVDLQRTSRDPSHLRGTVLRGAAAALTGLSCATALAAVGWNVEASLATPRAQHAAGLLDDGSVVVVNGVNSLGFVPGAERYAGGAWTALAPSGIIGNVTEAVTLGTGQLLVRTDGSAQARLYDPATQAWQPAGTQTAMRSLPTMTLLADGTVLVAGGSSLASAEQYDPRTRTWAPTGSMATERQAHAAVLMRDGRVLAVSGFSNALGEVPSAELYDPASGTWSYAAPPLVPRHYASLTLLPDGRALLTGGFTAGGVTAQSELYDPVANTWTATGFLNFPRNGYGMGTVLPSGRVLIAGGADSARNVQAAAEIYEPATGMWTAVESMATPRENPTSTLLPDGDVLVAGGFSSNPASTFYADVERYSPDKGPGTAPVLDALPLLQQAGAFWTLTGSGFAGAGAPVLQLQRAENGSLWRYAPASYTATSLSLAAAPSDLPAGLYMASVLVDGMPSQARLVRFVDAPAAPSATAGMGQATVGWAPLANDRGDPPDGYVVTSMPASAGCAAAVPATSCTVTGLSGGTSYVFYVQARHPNGLGPRSPASTAVTVAGPGALTSPTGVPGLSGAAVALLSAAMAGLAATRRLRSRRR